MPARETELYGPVKAFLEGQGYVVRGEVGGCDVLGVRGEEPPVVVELKLRLNLELLLQAVDRLELTDGVYVAVPRPGRGKRDGVGISPLEPRVRRLCLRLGVGLLMVAPGGPVEVIVDPLPYTPRKNRGRLTRLLGEHARRAGDFNLGGSNRTKLLTAYRQDAIHCARLLQQLGPSTPKTLRQGGAPKDAGSILRADHYGWFERVDRGVYRLTERGHTELPDYAHVP